jgi:hypothetical protein
MLMMTNEADGAVVIVSGVVMVMDHRNEHGEQENRYENRCKTFELSHVPLSHETNYAFLKVLSTGCLHTARAFERYRDFTAHHRSVHVRAFVGAGVHAHAYGNVCLSLLVSFQT